MEILILENFRKLKKRENLKEYTIFFLTNYIDLIMLFFSLIRFFYIIASFFWYFF